MNRVCKHCNRSSQRQVAQKKDNSHPGVSRTSFGGGYGTAPDSAEHRYRQKGSKR